MPRHTLICTIGTSLLSSILSKLRDDIPDPTLAVLAESYTANNWQKVAGLLRELNPTDRRCGSGD